MHEIYESTPLPRRSLAAELTAELRRLIVEGHYRAGERLPTEMELMRRYGVGRSTVREAVRTLVEAGMLRVKQGSGTYVETWSDDDPVVRRMRQADHRHLDEVRRILETAVVRLAAERCTGREAEKIGRCLAYRDEAARSGSLAGAIEADIAFHSAVADATHNSILGELYRATAVYLERGFREHFEAAECFLASQPQHERLYRALLAHDADEAVRLTDDIVRESRIGCRKSRSRQ